MRKILSVALVLSILMGMLVMPSKVEATPPAYFSLAEHWAPVIYQDVNEHHDVRGDFISKFNFDGNWAGNDNWDNYDQYPLEAYVYYSVQETVTHYFIGYYFFHAKDDADVDADKHENDMEGILLVIKKNGSAFGTFQLMETQAHNQWYQYTNDSNITAGYDDIDGEVRFQYHRPKVHVQANGNFWEAGGRGHGVHAYYDTLPRESGGFRYIYTGEAQVPDTEAVKGNYTYSCGYALTSIDEIWDLRFGNPTEDGLKYGDGHTFGSFGRFDGDGSRGGGGDDGAKAPWGWDDPDDGPVGQGINFSDPAHFIDVHLNGLGEFSHVYLFNPYYSYKVVLSEISSESNRDSVSVISGKSDIYPVLYMVPTNPSALGDLYLDQRMWKKDNASIGVNYRVKWGDYQTEGGDHFSTNYNWLYIINDPTYDFYLQVYDADLGQDEHMLTVVIDPDSIVSSETMVLPAANNPYPDNDAKVKLTISRNTGQHDAPPDTAPPAITFRTTGQADNTSRVTYVTNGSANPANVGDFNIQVYDIDVNRPDNIISRVEIKRIRPGQPDTVVKTYQVGAYEFNKFLEDVYGCMNPNGSVWYDTIQTFKVAVYQGNNVYESQPLTVEIIEDIGPYFVVSPFRLEPKHINNVYLLTAEYTSPYHASEIIDASKDPKFYVKVGSHDNLESSKITKVEIIEINADGTISDSVVAAFDYPENQQRHVVKVEALASICMDSSLDKSFKIRATTKGGRAYTSETVRALWNIDADKPWIRFGIADYDESIATYANQKLATDIVEYDTIRNADPKFQIAVEGNKIIDKVEIVDETDKPIWSKDISTLSTTSFEYSVRIFPITKVYGKYRTKLTARNGQVYYSQDIRIDWQEWKLSNENVRLHIKGHPVNMDSVSIISDKAPQDAGSNGPILVIDYWAWLTEGGGTSVPAYVNIKDASSNAILETITVSRQTQSGTINRYNLGHLMGGSNNRTIYAELVCEGDFQVRRSRDLSIQWLVNNPPEITIRPYGQTPVNGIVEIISDKLPSQVTPGELQDFQINISEPNGLDEDKIYRVALLDGSNNTIESVDVTNQDSSTIMLSFNPAGYMNDNYQYYGESFIKAFIVKAVDGDCKVHSKAVTVKWKCTNTLDTLEFAANIAPSPIDNIIDLASVPEGVEPTFSISANESQHLEGFKLDSVELISGSYYGGEPERVVMSVASINDWGAELSKSIIDAMDGSMLRYFYVRVKNKGGQVFTSNPLVVRNEIPYMTFKIEGMNIPQGYPMDNVIWMQTDLLPGQVEDGWIIIEKGWEYDVELWTTDGQQVNISGWRFALGETMGDKLDRSFIVILKHIDTQRRYVFEPIRVLWDCTNTANISLSANGQPEGSTLSIIGLPDEMSESQRPKFSLSFNETDLLPDFDIAKLEIVTADGRTARLIDFRGSAGSTYQVTNLQIDIAECLAGAAQEQFKLVGTNKGGQVFETGYITVNWQYRSALVIGFTAEGREQNSNNVTVYSEYTPQEAVTHGIGPDFNITLSSLAGSLDNTIRSIWILDSTGRILKNINVPSQTQSTVTIAADIAECMGTSMSKTFYVNVVLSSGSTYEAPNPLHVNWLIDVRPTITYTLNNAAEGETVNIGYPSYIEPIIQVNVSDPGSMQGDIIDKVEVLTVSNLVLKSISTASQNSTNVEVSANMAAFLKPGYNYYYVGVTNRAGKQYYTSIIYVYYGNKPGEEFPEM